MGDRRCNVKELAEHTGNAQATSWSRGLLEKLTGLQIAKKSLTFYGTRKFITAFTSARLLSLT